jgi:hypothetical protein
MPSELKPTTRKERKRWKYEIDSDDCNPSVESLFLLRLIADVDRLSAIIIAMHQCANGDNISGVLCEAQDYFETYGGDDA